MSPIRLMAMFVHAHCVVQTVCLDKLADAMPADTKRDSNMRWHQRFLASYAIDLNLIDRIKFSMLPDMYECVLSMDCTNWKLRKFNINILMLA